MVNNPDRKTIMMVNSPNNNKEIKKISPQSVIVK